VQQLVRRIKEGGAIGETDDMALAGILSTQLLHYQFVQNFEVPASLGPGSKIKFCGSAKHVAKPALP